MTHEDGQDMLADVALAVSQCRATMKQNEEYMAELRAYFDAWQTLVAGHRDQIAGLRKMSDKLLVLGQRLGEYLEEHNQGGEDSREWWQRGDEPPI